MGNTKHLPCPDCGLDLFHEDCEETTTLVNVTPTPVFAGQKGQREVPALICPECGAEKAL